MGGFPPDFFMRPVDVVARALLGVRLASTIGGVRTGGVIVETEAYGGAEDPASHAAVRAGRTRRNSPMFGPGGIAYVYRIYGVHWCLNVVTGAEGMAAAVLIRGIEAREGVDEMTRRREGRTPLTAGPGRVAQALGVDGSLSGHDLAADPLRILPGVAVDDGSIGVSGRIGVRAAADRPLRFYVVGSHGVSRAPSRMENG